MSISLTNSSMELATATTIDVIITSIQLIYGIPSLLLMIFFFFLLACSKDYRNSFHRYVQLDLLTNIICYINTWISLRIGKYTYGIAILKTIETTYPGLLTISAYACRVFMHMQVFTAAGLSIHRICVLRNVSLKTLGRWYPFYGLLCVIVSFFFEICLPGKTISFENEYIQLDSNGVLTKFRNMVWVKQSSYIIASFSLFYFILLALLGVVSTHLIVKNLNGSNQTLSFKKTTYRFAIVYTVIYIGVLFFTVFSALNGMMEIVPSFNLLSSAILTFGSDMMTLALPYILIAFEKNVRKLLRRK